MRLLRPHNTLAHSFASVLLFFGASSCSSSPTGPRQGELVDPGEPTPTSVVADPTATDVPTAPPPADQPADEILQTPPPADTTTPLEAEPPPPTDPCVEAACTDGFRCEVNGDVGTCVENTCDDLACSATERCVAHAEGGNICQDNSCSEDVDCDASEFCGEGGSCVPDTCTAGLRTCDGNDVVECSSNGAAMAVAYSCASSSAFATVCQDFGGQAACTCEDDWDCPANTVCEVDRCVGTGKTATCTIPPQEFSATRPAAEIRWGGLSRTDDAARDGSGDGTMAPWPDSSHITSTAMVANLTDDNGDGLINEFDYPEIIFVTYEANKLETTGVVRAIHGGGPNRGKDFFARCGDTLWHEGDPAPVGACENDASLSAHARSAVAIADLTGNGVPEIVYTTDNNGFRILNNQGELLLDQATEPLLVETNTGGNPRAGDISIANLDEVGMPELIYGRTVIMLGIDAQGLIYVKYRLDGTGSEGKNDNAGTMTCVADLAPAPGQEVLAGATLYRIPDGLPDCATPPCAAELETVWSAADVNGTSLTQSEGFCAIADVWGADSSPPGPANPPDGAPEAILIADGNLVILEGSTGGLIEQRVLDDSVGGTSGRGGAPNVDDFDGDGFMEIASALSQFYVVVDLQEPSDACPAWPTILPQTGANPNETAGLNRSPGTAACATDADCAAGAVCNIIASQCVCLHNGWSRDTDDDSSRATSSSVFDFNGDGAAEALYNDECNFYVYNGRTGEVLSSETSRSRTWTENPVVADVDNDGNAEVISVSNTEFIQCDVSEGRQGGGGAGGNEPAGPNGLTVWGDPSDTWVSARRIWNQSSYHVTNITENATVPLIEPNSWQTFNGRGYNTYRSQPRVFGVAPDLTVAAVSYSSPDVACGQLSDVIEVAFEIANPGDLRVGPGVEVTLYGTWDGVEETLQGPAGDLTVALDQSIEPGKSIIRTATFDVANQPNHDTLPDSLRVVVDSGGAADSDFGAERECDETNNDLSKDIEPGETRPDLGIAVGEATVDCRDGVATVQVKVTNYGTETADGVVVSIYAGNPAQGGAKFTDVTLDAPLEAGAEVDLSVEIEGFPFGREVTLWGTVDPDNLISECDEADNSDPADNAIICVANIDPK